ncbi:fungal-specific transcription factor domain-containing protein [Aspergillus keveii]|uniref:Fungal-specific transcription factor domain-containing protein n=1 Tax=Aspergillus keveii TaxID=714993 RepID=A0ABR4G470_9EURO
MTSNKQQDDFQVIEFKVARARSTRASRACINCRDRKVRCDALRQGMPCTNCRLDNGECVLGKARKGKSKHREAAKASTSSTHRTVETVPDPAETSRPPQRVHHFPARFRFLKKLSCRLKHDEISFLQAKGALSVPERPSLRVFLRAYVYHVHPYMPILDLHWLIASICDNRAEYRMSLFLLQAILFASVPFVTETFLSVAGYKDRECARRTLFHRAKTLYDFDVEDDKLVVVQGLLLLSLWHGTPDDLSGCWDWAGLSITWALRLGLDRDGEPPASRGYKWETRGLRRRIWWSVYIRDRLTALWMQRAARIDDRSFSVPTLTLDDFERPIVSKALLGFMYDSDHLSSARAREELGEAFIDLSTLCGHIGRVLDIKFKSPESIAYRGICEFDEFSTKVRKCKRDLRAWFMDRQLRYNMLVTSGTTNGVIRTLSSLVRMLYSTTQINLFLFERLDLSSEETTMPELSDEARKITETMSTLSQAKLIQYLPITAVNVLLPAVAIHILELGSADPTLSRTGYQSLGKCFDALRQLSAVYSVAGLPNLLYEASVLGTTAALPFRALAKAREAHVPFTGYTLERRILAGGCAAFEDIVLDLPSVPSGGEGVFCVDPSYLEPHG